MTVHQQNIILKFLKECSPDSMVNKLSNNYITLGLDSTLRLLNVAYSLTLQRVQMKIYLLSSVTNSMLIDIWGESTTPSLGISSNIRTTIPTQSGRMNM